MRTPIALLFLSGCHLLDSGQIERTCEDLQQGCSEADTGLEPVDADGDGFTDADDCDDSDHRVYPGAVELCDGIDSDCDGTEASGIVSVAGSNHTTIQSAIDAAAPRMTVHICSGVWNENLSISQSMSLLGWNETGDIQVRASEPGPTIHITGGEVEITGLIIEGGTGFSWVYESQSPILVGGGIAVETGGLILSESQVENNTAEAGSGVFGSPEAGLIEIRDSVIRANTATGLAGGVLTFSDMTFVNSTISENEAPNAAGLYAFESTILLHDSHLALNIATSSYGGVLMHTGNLICQSESSIQGNQAGAEGGGLTLMEASATGCLVADNEAAYGAGVYVAPSNSATATSLVIRGNDADTAGGGLYLNDASVVMESCTFEGNEAPLGAGLYLDDEDSQVMISGGEFISNTARSSGGGIYYVSGDLDVLSVDFGLNDQANLPDDFLDSSAWGGGQSYSQFGSNTSIQCREMVFDDAYGCESVDSD